MKKNDVAENTGQHIDRILTTTICAHHGADQGTPCWQFWRGFGRGLVRGVCGTRIRRAGFIGVISPDSLARSSVRSKKNGSRKQV